MLVWDFNKVFKMRGIEKPIKWLRALGVSRRLASKIANNQCDKLSLYHLELLCEHLKCTPHDFMLWKPLKAQAENEHHALRILLPDKTGTRTANLLKKLTLVQIRELEKLLRKGAGSDDAGKG